MKNSIFTISKELDELIYDLVDPETGEVSEEAESQILALEMDKDNKLLDIGKYIVSMKSDLAGYKEAEKRIKTNIARTQKGIDGLSGVLSMFLEGRKMADSEVSLSFRKSSAVVVSIDADKLPKSCRVHNPESYTADKKAIARHFKSGIAIDGCEIVERQNLQIK